MPNIILIDDDRAAHVYHKLMIEEAGLDIEKVRSFYTVNETLAYLCKLDALGKEGDWPTYIFIDINMPVKSGFDFLDEYKEGAFDFPWPKIYFVSSTTNPFDAQKIQDLPGVHGLKNKFLDRAFFETLI